MFKIQKFKTTPFTFVIGFIFCLAFLLLHCGPSKSSKPKTSKALPKISEKENSLFYYIASQLQGIEGKGEHSLFLLDRSLKKNPDSPYLLVRKAYEYARNNHLEEAQRMAEKALKKSPQDLELLLLLAKIYMTQADHPKAIAFFEKVISLDSSNEEAYTLLARVHLMKDQPQKAVTILKKLTQVNLESGSAYFFLANIYATQIKDYDRAVSYYQRILDLNPDDLRVLGLMVEAYLAQKNYSKALETLQKIKMLNPEDLSTDIRIALLYYELKQLDLALVTLQKVLETNPHSDRIRFYLGLLYQEKKDFDRALLHYEQVPARSEFFDEASLRRALIYRQQKKMDLALEVAKTAVQSKSKSVEAYDLLATLYVVGKDFKNAEAVLLKGLQVIPKSEPLLFTAGVLYERMGKWQKSVLMMKKVLAINANHAMALNFIGYTYAEKGQNLDEAQNLIEKALKLKPNDGFILDSLAWVHFLKGNLALALEMLEKANRLSPDEPTILEHLGEVFLKKQNHQKSRLYFEEALTKLKKLADKDQRDEEQIKRIEEKLDRF